MRPGFGLRLHAERPVQFHLPHSRLLGDALLDDEVGLQRRDRRGDRDGRRLDRHLRRVSDGRREQPHAGPRRRGVSGRGDVRGSEGAAGPSTGPPADSGGPELHHQRRRGRLLRDGEQRCLLALQPGLRCGRRKLPRSAARGLQHGLVYCRDRLPEQRLRSPDRGGVWRFHGLPRQGASVGPDPAACELRRSGSGEFGAVPGGKGLGLWNPALRRVQVQRRQLPVNQ